MRRPLAQPRNLVGGHLISAVIGVAAWCQKKVSKNIFYDYNCKLIHIKELNVHLYYLVIEMHGSRAEISYDRLTHTAT